MAGSNMAVDVMVRLKDRLSGPLGRLKNNLSGFVKFLKVGLIAGLTAALASTTALASEAIKFQRLWADANKTLGMSSRQLQQLKGDFDQLSFRIPLTREQFAEMAGVAGNIGIRGREAIGDFVELAAIVGSTFDGVTPEQGAEFMGGWMESLKYNQAELETTVDQINFLGNTTNAGAGALAKYAAGALAIGDAAGYAREETLALGTAVLAGRKDIAPEAAVTGFRAMNRFLTGGDAALTSTQDAIVKSLGLDMDQIQKQMVTDATGAIRTVATAISKMPIEKRNSIVTQLSGDEAARVFGPMLTNIENLEAALGRIDKLRTESAGSARKEFEGVNDTVSANWQKLKNVFSAMRDAGGQPMLEPINNGLKWTIELLTTLDDRVTVFDRMEALTSGFVKGFGLDRFFRRAEAGADRFWKALEPVNDFLFGKNLSGVDEGFKRVLRAADQNSLKSLSKRFTDAGAALRSFFDGIRAGDINGTLSKLKNLGKAIGDLLGVGDTAGYAMLAFGGLQLAKLAVGVLAFLPYRKGLLIAVAAGIGAISKVVEEMANGASFSEAISNLNNLEKAVAGVAMAFGTWKVFQVGKGVKGLLGGLGGKGAKGAAGAAGGAAGAAGTAGTAAGVGLATGSAAAGAVVYEGLAFAEAWDEISSAWKNLTDGYSEEEKKEREKAWDKNRRMIDEIRAKKGLAPLGAPVPDLPPPAPLSDISTVDLPKWGADRFAGPPVNDNVQGKRSGAIAMPDRLNTQPVNGDAAKRLANPVGSVPASSSGGGSGDGVQKVEFAPLKHEVTSQVEVGGSVNISVIGPAKVTGTSSTNPNAPVTVNTGRAVGRP